MIHFRTLGSVDLRGAEGESLDPILAQPKRTALLAYLVLARPRGYHRRDVLLGIFWPESDATHARAALNQSLRFLRRFLGTEALLSRGSEEVAVDPFYVSCDALTFEESAVGDEQGALELYRGQLLEGFFVSDAPLFEHWLDIERARFRETARAVADQLVARSEEAGDLKAALHWCHRAFDLSVWDEAVLRRLLDLLDRSGDRARAVREYDVFASRLRAELDVEPSPETRATMDRIRARVDPTPMAPSEPAIPPRASATGPPAGAFLSGEARAPGRLAASARVASVLALLLLGAAGLRLAGTGATDTQRILVMPLENRTGDPTLDVVGTIAADWIVQGLASTQTVDVVPSLHTAQLLQELPREAGYGDAMTRGRTVADVVGAGVVVIGSYHERDADLEFEVRVIHVHEDRLMRGIDGIRGPRDDPMAAIDQLRSRAVGAVAFDFEELVSRFAPSAIRPPSHAAYRAFAAGMDQRNQRGPLEAVGYFHQAFALDPTFTMAIFLAAIQHLELGEFAEADSLIRIYAGSLERLPPLERQFLEWIEAQIRGDIPGALEAARRLMRFSDGFRGQVAYDALRANRPLEAIDANRGVDVEHQSRRWRLTYGRRMTDAYHRVGSHHRELTEAKRSRERVPDHPEPVVLEMRALIAMGRLELARDRLQEALSITSGNRWTAGEIMLRAADELHAHGHDRTGREILHSAAEWYRDLPDRDVGLERHRRHRATVLLRADSLGAAVALFRELAMEFPNDPYYRASIGVALARGGDRRGAQELARTLEKNPPYDFGHHLYERARIAAQLGDSAEALELLQQAFTAGFDFDFVGGNRVSIPRPPDGAPHLDPAFHGLRAHAAFEAMARGGE